VPTSLLSPSRYVSAPGAVQGVGEAVSRLGCKAVVVAGGVGLSAVAPQLEASLTGVVASRLTHRGACSVAAVERLAGEAAAQSCDVLVGVGGGRALDVTKGAAEALQVPYVLVPTSPTTCAATTAVIVEYSVDGVYQRSRLVAEPAAYAFVDPGVLAGAPDRLLAAGLVDALAKVVEVRYASRRLGQRSAALVAALALCDELERTVFRDSGAAVAPHGVGL
jgi:glycerol dehydrogenase